MVKQIRDPGPINLFQMGFAFAVQKIEPSIGTILVSHVEIDGIYKTSKSIELQDCSELLLPYGNNFDYLFNKEWKSQMSNFLCPLNLDQFPIEHDTDVSGAQYIKIELAGCSLEQAECATDEQVAKASFRILMGDATPNIINYSLGYFVKFSADSRHYFHPDPTHVQIENIYLGVSFMKMHRTYWDIFEFNEHEVEFVEQLNSERFLQWQPTGKTPQDRSYIKVLLRQDKHRMDYRRNEYDVLSFAGDLGGLFSFLYGLGMLSTSPFAVRLFHAAIISQFYRV